MLCWMQQKKNLLAFSYLYLFRCHYSSKNGCIWHPCSQTKVTWLMVSKYFCFPFSASWDLEAPFRIFYKEDNVEGRYKKPSRIPSFLGAILERRLEKRFSKRRLSAISFCTLKRDLLGDVVLFQKRKIWKSLLNSHFLKGWAIRATIDC